MQIPISLGLSCGVSRSTCAIIRKKRRFVKHFFEIFCRNRKKDALSPRIPRDTEHERYHPELEEELKECLFCLHRNEMLFDLEVDTDLIEQHIYERQALLARYRYLLGKARELGLHTILEKYQPVG